MNESVLIWLSADDILNAAAIAPFSRDVVVQYDDARSNYRTNCAGN